MWWTADGELVLKGAEAQVFASSVINMLGHTSPLEDMSPLEYGISAFDRLTLGQQVSAITVVAYGLLRKEFSRVMLTAALDSTIATVYENVKECVSFECECECDSDLSIFWRELVRNAMKETGEEELPDVNSDDVNEWLFIVDCLRDRLLWDYDFEMIDECLDDPPEVAKAVKGLLTIDKDYFVTVPYDLEDDEIVFAIEDLRRLCQRFE